MDRKVVIALVVVALILGLGIGGLLLRPSAPEPVVQEPVQEPAEEPAEEPAVEEPVVAEPVAEGDALLPGGFPRNETLITSILTGQVMTPDDFNVWTVTWKHPDRGIQQLMLEPLWIVDFATGEVISALANELPIYNEDFTQMTVKMRDGMYWSDGVQITSADVVFTVETIKKHPELGNNGQFNTFVERVHAPDPLTVVFELTQPNTRFHSFFLDRWGATRPMPKHIFETAESVPAFSFNPPISSGPFVMNSYDPAGAWVMWERREDWERTPTGELFGMPAPTYVLFRHDGPPEKRVLAQGRNMLDMADMSMEALRASLMVNPNTRAYREEYPWVVNADPAMTGLTFNTKVFPFDQSEVRWALTLAIDIVDFKAIAFDGAATMGAMHVPPTPVYQEWYYGPMDSWLREFSIDVDGESFRPFDPDAPIRMAEHARLRGFTIPEDEQEIRAMFGTGWWKFAPEIATRLLEGQGFTKRGGRWHLPDGTPWSINLVTGVNPVGIGERNAFAAAQQWGRFGIDVQIAPSPMSGTLIDNGEFDVGVNWPVIEPWGGHPDLYRSFVAWNSIFMRPVGESNPGHDGRWSDPRMDEVISSLETSDWDGEQALELSKRGLMIAVEEMPSIPTVSFPGMIVWDETYWTNFPGAENPYTQPYHHWPNFKYMLPFLQPTGR